MRKTAITLLKGRWLKAAAVTFITLSAVLALMLIQLFLKDTIALIASLLFLVFAVRPILLGHKRWCGKLTPNEKAKVKDVFYFFSTPKRYFKGVATGLVVYLRVFFTALFSMAFPAVCFLLAQWLTKQPQSEIMQMFINNCMILGIVATVVFSVLFIMLSVKNLAVMYFVAENENMKIIDAIRASSQFVRQEGGYIFKTFLLMIPLVLMIIPVFLIIPYFDTVFAQCVKKFLQ